MYNKLVKNQHLSINYCISTDCPPIDEIINGYIKCTEENKIGSVCTYQCNQGMNHLISL